MLLVSLVGDDNNYIKKSKNKIRRKKKDNAMTESESNGI